MQFVRFKTNTLLAVQIFFSFRFPINEKSKYLMKHNITHKDLRKCPIQVCPFLMYNLKMQ